MITSTLSTSVSWSAFAVFSMGGLALVVAAGQRDQREQANESSMMRELIKDSSELSFLGDSVALQEGHVAHDELAKFRKFIEAHRDYRSYHLLMALYRDCPDAYYGIPEATRTKVLTSAFKETLFYNEWGDLDDDWKKLIDQPKERTAYDPRWALLEMGPLVIPELLPMLDDLGDAQLEGSEEATMSIDCKYRKADWACLYISLILKMPYRFDVSPKERDKGIALLKLTQ